MEWRARFLELFLKGTEGTQSYYEKDYVINNLKMINVNLDSIKIEK